MLFGRSTQHKQEPPAGLGAQDIATESSICTGETVIGFKEPKTGKLLQAVAVQNKKDIERYYHRYGFAPMGRR